MNFLSFSLLNCKISLIRTLLDRIRKINNTETGFQEDLKQLTFTLKRDLFPFHVIDEIIWKYNEDVACDNKQCHSRRQTETSLI